MLKKMSLLVLLIIFVVSNPIKAQNDQDTSNNQGMSGSSTIGTNSMSGMQSGDVKAVMQKVHSELMQAQLSGDPQKDFAHLMIQHHQGAIDMSNLVIQNGKNDDVKRIAQKIVDDSNNDLAVLSKYSSENAAARSNEGNDETTTPGTSDSTGNYSNPGTSGTPGTSGSTITAGSSGLMAGVADIAGDVDNVQTTGDVDQDYVAMMIIHNKESIKLSENFISQNSSGDLNTLAQNIIDTSKKDIEDLQRFSSK